MRGKGRPIVTSESFFPHDSLFFVALFAFTRFRVFRMAPEVVRENFSVGAKFTQSRLARVHNSFTKALLQANTRAARVMLELGNVAHR